MTPADLSALRAEVAYQRAIPPWCRLKTTMEHMQLYPCYRITMGCVQHIGRPCCHGCTYHNREAGTHPAERMNARSHHGL